MAESQNPTDVQTLQMMTEGGGHVVRADSGQGTLYRPSLVSESMGSRTASLETLYDFWINHVPDPDYALQQDPDFDEKLRMHPDVHAPMRLRELTVASMPARIEPSDARGIRRKVARVIANYVEEVMDGLSNRQDLYRQMQNAVLMGGQGIEFNWRTIKGAPRPIEYYPVHKSRFVFDRLGNLCLLTRTRPVWGEYVAENPQRINTGNGSEMVFPVPKGKFVYHKYMAEGGPWQRPAGEGYLYYGRGEDTNLFYPVSFDQFILRFRMKWLERHGFPFTKLYYPESDENVKRKVQDIAESIRGEAIATLPKRAGENNGTYYDVEFDHPAGTGQDAFSRFNEEWTKPRIEKIILGGANLLDTGQQGSYAAVVNQRDQGSDIIFRYDAKNIDATLDQQLIPFIVWAKFPGCPMEYMPRHVMEPKEEVDQAQKLQNIRMAAEMVPVYKNEVYEAAGLTQPGKEDEEEDADTIYLGQSQDTPGAYDGFPAINPSQNSEGGGQDAAQTQKRRQQSQGAQKQGPVSRANAKTGAG